MIQKFVSRCFVKKYLRKFLLKLLELRLFFKSHVILFQALIVLTVNVRPPSVSLLYLGQFKFRFDYLVFLL